MNVSLFRTVEGSGLLKSADAPDLVIASPAAADEAEKLLTVDNKSFRFKSSAIFSLVGAVTSTYNYVMSVDKDYLAQIQQLTNSNSLSVSEMPMGKSTSDITGPTNALITFAPQGASAFRMNYITSCGVIVKLTQSNREVNAAEYTYNVTVAIGGATIFTQDVSITASTEGRDLKAAAMTLFMTNASLPVSAGSAATVSTYIQENPSEKVFTVYGLNSSVANPFIPSPATITVSLDANVNTVSNVTVEVIMLTPKSKVFKTLQVLAAIASGRQQVDQAYADMLIATAGKIDAARFTSS